jgi:hypothetical protein
MNSEVRCSHDDESDLSQDHQCSLLLQSGSKAIEFALSFDGEFSSFFISP